MLINRDIWCLIEQDVPGFQTLSLFDTEVVIHAHDFCYQLIYRSNYPVKYGGENLQFKADLESMLNVFQQCKIRPIFLFNGISVSHKNNRESNVQTLQNRIKNLEWPVQSDSEKKSGQGSLRTPIFTKEILLGLLKKRGIPHMICDAEIIPSCVALAAYLRCPVLANCCELFLYDFDEPDGNLNRFLYLPLRYFSFTPTRNVATTDGMGLSAHVYSPSKCSLNQIPHTLRPFFAVYFKPPNAFHYPIPYGVFNAIKRGIVQANQPMVQRAKALMDWLHSARSSAEVLEESIKQYDKKVIISFIEELVAATKYLEIDLAQGERMAKFLFPDKQFTAPRQNFVDLITDLTQNPRPNQCKQVINLIETENCLFGNEIDEIFAKLPPYFRNLYHGGYISTVMLLNLLSSDVIVPILEEDLSLNSAADRVMGLRFLQYSFAFDFLQRNGYDIEHFEGSTDPWISELSRSTDPTHFIVTKVKLTPLPPLRTDLSDLAQICHLFIQENMGCEIKSVNNWIDVLALTLTLWHKAGNSNTDFDIFEQPTALAVALITSVVVASGCSATPQDLNKLVEAMPQGTDKKILHEISELQLVYISTLSLLKFVSTVAICESTSYMNMTMVKLPPAEWIFSSSHLIHNLAATLAESPERKHLNKWIEKLLSPLSEGATFVKNATINMVHLTRTLVQMRSSRSITFNSKREILPLPERDIHSGRNRTERRSNPGQNAPNPHVVGRNGNPNANFQKGFINNGQFNSNGTGPYKRDFGHAPQTQRPRFGGNVVRNFTPNSANYRSRYGEDRSNRQNGESEALLKPGSMNRPNNSCAKEPIPKPAGAAIVDGKEVSGNGPVNGDSADRCDKPCTRLDNLQNTVAEDGATASKTAFLPNSSNKAEYAASEIGHRQFNERDYDARKLPDVPASEFGFPQRSGGYNRKGSFKPRGYPSRVGPNFPCQSPDFQKTNLRNENTATPGGDSHDRQIDGVKTKQEVNGFRKSLPNQQKPYQCQPKQSFNNSQRRNSNNFNGADSREKPHNKAFYGGVPRRNAAFNNNRGNPKTGSQGAPKQDWNLSSLSSAIDKIASEF